MARPPKQTSTAIIANNKQEMEDLRARLLAPSGSRIRIENKQFNFPNGDIAPSMDAVIVEFVYANNFYETEYDPNVIVPPDCFARNPQPNDLAPSTLSPLKQSDSCKNCPQNVHIDGKAKVCKNRILLALLAADATEDTPFSLLDISPTALRGFTSYVSTVARVLNRMPYGAISHIGFNEALKYDVVVFSEPRVIDNEAYIDMIRGRREEARAFLMTEPDIVAMQAANDAKTKTKKPLRRLGNGKRRML